MFASLQPIASRSVSVSYLVCKQGAGCYDNCKINCIDVYGLIAFICLDFVPDACSPQEDIYLSCKFHEKSSQAL